MAAGIGPVLARRGATLTGRMGAQGGTAARLYVYKLTTDNGGAPCIRRGVLSLAICKPNIRRTARPGDWIFGFGGKDLGGRLIYIACVGQRVEAGRYYVDAAFKGRRDRIYRSEDGTFRVRPGATYHSDGRQLTRDLGEPPSYTRAVTLLSSDFRYWGRRGTTNYQKRSPRLTKLLGRLTQGHRVNHPEAIREELITLQRLAWRSHPTTKVLGLPTEADWTKRCNGTEGACRI